MCLEILVLHSSFHTSYRFLVCQISRVTILEFSRFDIRLWHSLDVLNYPYHIFSRSISRMCTCNANCRCNMYANVKNVSYFDIVCAARSMSKVTNRLVFK